MPKIAPEAMEERRARIVAAALRVFARKGLSKVTLRDVFAEAGMSAGAVYNYFQSKDDIVLAVTEAGLANALPIFEGADPARPVTLDAVVAFFFERLIDERDTHAPRVDVMILAEALSNPNVASAVLKFRAAIRAALIPLVERRQAVDPGWAGLPAPVIAEMLYAAYQGLIVSASLGEQANIAGVGAALRRMRFN
jgi:AcrR family transcriptional regulator